MKCKDCNITNLDLDFYKNFTEWVIRNYNHIFEEWDNEYIKEGIPSK